ncbi:MAG: aldehyde dehydrogenase [Candidatus Binatia bacterium]|nr:MAG: aldehyde dehydrogenase [Candidatus Binatia bacterium]
MNEKKAYRIFVDGEWREASGGRTYPVVNPATEEVLAHVPDASPEDMDRAIRAARRAFDEGPWRKTTPEDRARILRRIVDGLERRKEEFRHLLVANAGATYVTHYIQLDVAIRILAHYAELAVKFPFEEPLPPATFDNPMYPGVTSALLVRQPVGVCGLVPAWNFPLFLTLQKLGPALGAGCTVVVKPSPFVPLVDLTLAEIVAECDLPKGVYNLVVGESPELGARLVESPLVDKISFTGSAATGKKIMAAAAPTLKRVHLELGGKSAAIVLDDSQLDAWVMATSSPSFFHAGQGCAMCTRVLVPKRLHDTFTSKVVDFLRSTVRPGDPADPSTLLGPVIREERRRKIEEYIRSGEREGARLATGGKRPEDRPKGYFLEPTVFCDVRNTMTIAREEIFGPVLAILPFEDEEEAIRIANDSPYGLGGAIYASDTAKAIELAKRIRTGTVNINGGVTLLDAPFGGFKESGIGREGGIWSFYEYTEMQTIAWK